jgi:hypothetical protein
VEHLMVISITIDTPVEQKEFEKAFYTAYYEIYNKTGIRPEELLISKEDERKIQRSEWANILMQYANPMTPFTVTLTSLFGVDVLLCDKPRQPQIRAYVKY